MLLSMYIVNRAGSLLYCRDFANIPRLPTNDRMRLLSTFHRSGFIAIRVAPPRHVPA